MVRKAKAKARARAEAAKKKSLAKAKALEQEAPPAPPDEAPAEVPVVLEGTPQENDSEVPTSHVPPADAPVDVPAPPSDPEPVSEPAKPEPSPVSVAGEQLKKLEDTFSTKVKELADKGEHLSEAQQMQLGAVQVFNQVKSLLEKTDASLAEWEKKYVDVRTEAEKVEKGRQFIISKSGRCSTEYGAFEKMKGMSSPDFYRMLDVLKLLSDEEVKKFVDAVTTK